MMKAFSESIWARPEEPALLSALSPAGERLDLVVIGGGILGLSTALQARRRGLSVQVLEAGAIGGGASGLNGGQVIPGLKYDPAALIAAFGEERGARLVAFAAATADAVFDLIRDEKMDVPHRRNGWIQAAHTEPALAAAIERARQWRQRGADVEALDASAIGRLTGAQGYLGGWLDRRAGVIDPLAFTRALAGRASEAGARVATGVRALRLEKRGGDWRIAIPGKELRAGAVLVATNAYADGLVEGLAKTLVPLNSFQIATAPLPDELSAPILPGGQAVSDSRRILVYYRKGPDGRMMLGGRGQLGWHAGARGWAHLERALTRLFPALAGVAIEKRWFGPIAVTPDHLPHIHEPETGLLAVVGCQGRGVGLMTAFGAPLASYFATGDATALPLPITPVRAIPLHRFRQIGVAATIAWYRMLDGLEGTARR